jgi:uncharacterized protein
MVDHAGGAAPGPAPHTSSISNRANGVRAAHHNRVRQPFRQYVLKVHSRCDLACDYCYVYTMADQRWRRRPRVMSTRTVDQVACRVAEHAGSHGLPSVDVVLHGGEPLLAGPARIAYCVQRLRSAVGAGTEVRVAVQTNGLRLGQEYLRLFASLGVRVGVSLDGDRAAHDRHRRNAAGQGSHARVEAALRLLARPPYRPLFSGLLCTIDLRNDPVATYEALLRFSPPAVDFLLPHGNWSAPPPGRDPLSPATPYADWLIPVFDRWYGAPRRETSVRLFDAVLDVLLGGHSTVEGIGLDPVPTVVVETDGAIEQSDFLTATFEGATDTGLHVARDPFDRALEVPGIAQRHGGVTALSPTCLGCDVHRVCGGGLYAHRYRDGGFAHPSVYCPDLYDLVTHIRNRVARDVALLRPAP